MAAILQGKESVFETDQFAPLIALGETLSGRVYGEDGETDRALRILADHSRAMTFLTADGVVPSNEDRGYVLRRVMRRAIQQGLALELEPGFLTRYSALVRDLMGGAYPELGEHAEVTDMWLAAEEESFGHTIAQGMATLRELIERARSEGLETIPAAEVFRLHDTYGFPYEMTRELLDEEALEIEGDFEALMDEQRERGRAGGRAGQAGGVGAARELAGVFAGESGFETRFTGYEAEEQHTTVGAVREFSENGGGERYLVKLTESPFYAPGGGQVADEGTIECDDGACVAQRARRVSHRRRPGSGGGARAREAARGGAGHGPRGPPRASRHRGQPHRDAPAPGGAARASSAPTSARPAPTSGPTSCASISATAPRSPARSCATSRTASTTGSPATTRCGR